MAYNNICIFRKSNSCIKCRNDTINVESNYCQLHIKNANNMFNILNIFLGSKKNLEISDLYPLLVYIYSHNNIIDDVNNLFNNIIDYIYSNKYKLLNIINSSLCYYNKKQLLNKYKKNNVINFIHNLLYNTYLISIDSKKIKSVIKIQKNILKYLIRKLHVIYDNEIPENNEDPFTFDSINEIPNNLKFSYKDNAGHLYTFNSIELDYFINKNGTWNPYTKEEFSEDFINKLNKFINYNRTERKSLENLYIWNTPLQAYTDVSQIIEKIGFYNNVEWFMKLSYTDIKNIICRYHYITTGIADSNLYFIDNIRKHSYIYDFARNIIKLFENGNEHYLLCCKFIKALSLYSKDFYNNLPSWLNYIDENIYINNNNFNDNTIIIRPIARNFLNNNNLNILLNPLSSNLSSRTIFESDYENTVIRAVEQLNMIFNILDDVD